MRINYIDADGTLCRSIFNNDRLKNDNNNCLTADFLKDLAAVRPYTWPLREAGREWFCTRDSVNIIVTGRLPEYETLTREWCARACGFRVDGYVSVPWDDTKATCEESYQHYVVHKVMKLTDIIDGWILAGQHSNIPMELHVYEDDKKVLDGVGDRFTDEQVHRHVVDDKGEVHDYP